MWIFGICCLVGLGLPWKLDVTHYHIDDAEVDVKVMVIADLHSCWFGKEQRRILKVVEREDPDVIVFPGDLFDELQEDDAVEALLRGLRGRSMYYVEGNHEKRGSSRQKEIWRSLLQKYGVCFLEDETCYLEQKHVEIGGLHCMGYTPDMTAKEVSSLFKTNEYRILLSHRNCYIDLYRHIDCDLIISGHAHGGQWRIPFLHKGIFAPQSGFFPAHTEGLHDLGRARFVISRGVNRSAHNIPRLFNDPEICIIQINSKKGDPYVKEIAAH